MGNAYPKFINVPEYNVISPGNACMLASIEMLLRVARPDLTSFMPAMYIQRSCNPGEGIDTFKRALEMIMEFSGKPTLWPESGEKYGWLGEIDYFRVFTGEKAAAVFERLIAYNDDDPFSGAFAFYDKTHAYCAAPRHLLTDMGRSDLEHVYSFNVSNVESTTALRQRKWFRKNFATNPSFEILCVDRNIGEEASLQRLSGKYMWNEHGVLYTQEEEEEEPPSSRG